MCMPIRWRRSYLHLRLATWISTSAWKDCPEERAETPSRWDDEELTFYQPDEVLSIEDLIRDEHSVDPEQLLAQEEAQEELQKAIASLPNEVREPFVLFALEGLNSDDVAMIMGKSLREIVQNVEKARMELRKHLGS